ncbi:AraC family transcriptional regulator [Chryseobacterium chendengshani]|uniref:helix-turn-helix domain-containing protein n=1 Tax=Chryseobacterium sp. LJ668 TaxID=2864040 RepID=UPI001C687546|nr:AraC family transcriptional regulator [Chryseobacterium sp. LJ668]MBW8523763.1 AraC family transcriptional regulator [Chryseobacterium sp. LJ668]QYK16707.1 AraC family transcriptional regulator [Chryseobacterium sp. LJ668]
MKLYIKYMVSLRCKMVVRDALEELKIRYSSLELGLVETCEKTSEKKRLKLSEILKKSGLVLLEDKKSILIEKIKTVVIEMIHYADEIPQQNFSDFLSQKLGYDYTYLANMFSEVKGITIQHFIILHKVERIKELLLYDELNLSEISYQLNYSSVAHLSNQFKKITGLTPSYFKKLGKKRKQNLEDF